MVKRRGRDAAAFTIAMVCQEGPSHVLLPAGGRRSEGDWGQSPLPRGTASGGIRADEDPRQSGAATGVGEKRSPFRLLSVSALAEGSGLGVAGVMAVDALGEETFTAALAAAGEGRASTFGRHARAEAMLVLSGAFGSLKGAFHSARSAKRMGAGMLGRERRLSIARNRRFPARMTIASAPAFWNKESSERESHDRAGDGGGFG